MKLIKLIVLLTVTTFAITTILQVQAANLAPTTIKTSNIGQVKSATSTKIDTKKQITLEGTLEILAFDDFRNLKNSRYEYFIKTVNSKIRIYPTSPLNLKSGSKVRLTGYQIGNMIFYDPSTTTAKTITSAPASSTTGNQKILVLLIDETSDPNTRPFTKAEVNDLVFNGQIQKFYNEQSYGQMRLTGDVYGWFTNNDIETIVKDNNIDLNQYRGIVEIINTDRIMTMASTLGQNIHIYNGISYNLSHVWMAARLVSTIDITKDFKWTMFDAIFVHEFGHSLGLMHANGWDCGDQTIYNGNCTNYEYGNPYDMMGASGYYGLHYNAAFKNQLGWLGPRLLDITKSGRYTISTLESTTGFAGAKISNPLNLNEAIYFVEYRKGQGFDSSLNKPEVLSNQQGLFINRFLTNANAARLFDMTPTSADWYNDILSATLNRSTTTSQNVFADTENAITIGPIVEHTPDSITFDVSMTSPSCTRALPQVNFLGLSPISLKAGDVGTILIEVINKDSFGCANSIFNLKPTLPENWIILYKDPDVSLLPNGINHFQVDFQVPSSAIGGNYVINNEISNLTSNLKTSYGINAIIQSTNKPTITKLTPLSGFTGTQVTIEGSNFTPTGNNVIFNKSIINNLNSQTGTNISFTVPKMTIGSYPVSVATVNGTSNNISFTIKPRYAPLPDVSLISPNGGETWTKGTTQKIIWSDNSLTSTYGCKDESFVYGAPCENPPQLTYDIKLISYNQPCTGIICPMYSYREYIIDSNVAGSAYSWVVGSLPRSQVIMNIPDGAFTIKVCQLGTTVCDSSDSYFNIISNQIEPKKTITTSQTSATWDSIKKWMRPIR